MVIRVRAVGLTLIGMLALAACGPKAAVKSEAPQAKQVAKAPVTYEPARDGLPRGQIWKSQLRFGDINGDGFADVAAVSRLLRRAVHVAFGREGTLDRCVARAPARDLLWRRRVVRRYQQGREDGHCHRRPLQRGVRFFGDGAGHWTNASAGLPTVGSEDVALGDFNKDGCLDVAMVAAADEGIRTFKGDCKGTWRRELRRPAEDGMGKRRSDGAT